MRSSLIKGFLPCWLGCGRSGWIASLFSRQEICESASSTPSEHRYLFFSGDFGLCPERGEQLPCAEPCRDSFSAVKAFHDKNQQYPKSLEELVPHHVKRVPLAKYTFMFNRFSYFTSDQGASLSSLPSRRLVDRHIPSRAMRGVI